MAAYSITIILWNSILKNSHNCILIDIQMIREISFAYANVMRFLNIYTLHIYIFLTCMQACFLRIKSLYTAIKKSTFVWIWTKQWLTCNRICFLRTIRVLLLIWSASDYGKDFICFSIFLNGLLWTTFRKSNGKILFTTYAWMHAHFCTTLFDVRLKQGWWVGAIKKFPATYVEEII